MLETLQKVLAFPTVYRAFSAVAGGSSSQHAIARDLIRAKSGDRVLDIGCGPADILTHLPSVDYVGFDASQRYIEQAIRNHGRRGQFYCQRVSEESLTHHAGFNLVLAVGVLHHLDDDEVLHLLRLARTALVPGGRLFTLDGVFVPQQSRAARFLISRDRGKHVRSLDGYLNLAGQVFNRVVSTVRHDLIRIPYTHLVMDCIKT